jgi:hypothetical protein
MRKNNKNIAKRWERRKNNKVRTFDNCVAPDLAGMRGSYFSERFSCNRCGEIHNSGYEFKNGVKICRKCKAAIRPLQAKIVYTPMGNNQ